MSDHLLLEIDGLRVDFTTRSGVVQAVRGVSLDVDRGETVGLVGESGSGKSVTVQAAMGLVNVPGEIAAGDIRWKGQSVLGVAGRSYARQVRGRELSMIFQDPMTSLNPVLDVGSQITEVLRHHLGMTKARAWSRAGELLELVGISNPETRMRQYPHEFSGGMRQRVMIAAALACEPELLIADEPTTALDVTIQAQILELLAELQKKLHLSVLVITHDLGLVAGFCHRILVMYGGQIVEAGPAAEIFERPGHPYTAGLLRSTPRLDVVNERLIAIDGSPPDPKNPLDGCAFRSRCPIAEAQCRDQPTLESCGDGRTAACWMPYRDCWNPDLTRRQTVV